MDEQDPLIREEFAKQMPITSPSTIGLDLEDFRRLGVRPYECRLSVIRGAAARSARALAKKQLISPSDQVGLQLSRVATSAYRLLDPRQRHDVNQRMHVGRILPIALSGAGQTNFHNGAENSSVNVSFRLDAFGEPVDLEMPAASLALGNRAAWTASLNHDDLLETTLLSSRVVRIQSRLRHPWVLLTIAGLAIGTILGLVTMRTRYEVSASRENDPARVSAPSASAELVAPPKLPLQQKAPPQDATEQATVALAPSPDSDASLSQPAPLLAESAGQRDVGIPQPIREMESDRIASVLKDPIASRTAADLPPETPPIDLVDPLSAEAISKPNSSTAIEPDLIPPNAALMPAVTRHGVPEDASVRAARIQLVSLVPQLAHVVSPKDVESRIAEIESLLDVLSLGSADDWAARMTIAELAWLVEDVSQVSQRLKTFTDIYQVPIHQPLSDSFITACDLAKLPETHQHLLNNGLRLADQLLMSESFERCRDVVDAIGPSAELLESESSLGYLKQFSQAAVQMDRLAQSAKRMMDDAGKIDGKSGDQGILGRYYCLMLRQWDVGLPWLAQVSDARIASVARQELAMGDAPSADDLLALSQRWLAVASRSSGRGSDSMRLHAIELMEQAESETRGLKQLEIERTMDEALELLPPFLRASSVPTTPVPATQRRPVAPPQSKEGLSGRIVVDGMDIGVQLDYELGVPLTQSILDTIAQRLNRSLSPMSIHFVGAFELDEATTLLVSIAPLADATQDIQFDGNRVELDVLEETAKVSLPAGRHQMDWTIEAARLSSRSYLRIDDSASSRPLRVMQPTNLADQRTTLTVAMVRGDQ